jgi:hypothetical protein
MCPDTTQIISIIANLLISLIVLSVTRVVRKPGRVKSMYTTRHVLIVRVCVANHLSYQCPTLPHISDK